MLGVPVPSKFTHAFEVRLATLSDSLVDVDNFEYVIDPSAGDDEISDVETVVILPLESTVSVTAAVFVP